MFFYFMLAEQKKDRHSAGLYTSLIYRLYVSKKTVTLVLAGSLACVCKLLQPNLFAVNKRDPLSADTLIGLVFFLARLISTGNE
jgi:hypothetical protein